MLIQMAIKTNLDIYYFQTPCMFTVFLLENSAINRESYKVYWMQLPENCEFSHSIQTNIYNTPEAV